MKLKNNTLKEFYTSTFRAFKSELESLFGKLTPIAAPVFNISIKIVDIFGFTANLGELQGIPSISDNQIDMRRKHIQDNLFRTLIGLIILTGFTNSLVAQDFDRFGASGSDVTFTDTLFIQSFNLQMDLEDQLLPLEEIIQVAIENNPEIRAQEYIAEGQYYNHLGVKKNWMNAFSVFGTYSAGDQSLISTDPITGSQNSQNISNGYQVGINARVTLYDLLGNKEIAKSEYMNYQAALKTSETIRMAVKRQVIGEYFNLVAAQKKYIVAAKNAETQYSSVRMAELELRNGRTTIQEYADSVGRSSDATANAQDMKALLFQSFYAFQELVGIELIYLKRNS